MYKQEILFPIQSRKYHLSFAAFPPFQSIQYFNLRFGNVPGMEVVSERLAVGSEDKYFGQFGNNVKMLSGKSLIFVAALLLFGN